VSHPPPHGAIAEFTEAKTLVAAVRAAQSTPTI
jgi:hypothetical protein